MGVQVILPGGCINSTQLFRCLRFSKQKRAQKSMFHLQTATCGCQIAYFKLHTILHVQGGITAYGLVHRDDAVHPTFSMASAIISPVSVSSADTAATCAMASRISTGLANFLMAAAAN